MRFKRYLRGQRVAIFDKETLIKAGYPDNNDKDDFLNLIAGKTITIQDCYEDGQIYTCKEYPGFAIYKVFIEKLISNDEKFSFAKIAKMLGYNHAETIRKQFKDHEEMIKVSLKEYL